MSSSIWKSLDVFAKQPQIYINQRENYATIYSFIISLIIGCVSLGFSFFFFSELFQRKGMTLIQSVEIPEVPLKTNVKKNHFFISMCLEDPITYDALIDEEIYTIEASYQTVTRKSNGTFDWTVKPLTLIPCSQLNINPEYQNQLKSKPLNNFYCVKDTDTDVNLEGTFLNDFYSMIMFKVFRCVNGTDSATGGKKCKSKEQMDYYLNGTFISLTFSDVTVNSNDYSKPEKPILSEAYSTIDSVSIKEMHVYLKSALVTTEENMYFKELITTKQYSQLDYVKEMQKSKLSNHVNQNQISEISFKLNNKIDHYKRNYLTIATVMGNLGGVIKTISFAGTLLTILIGNSQYEMFVIDRMFNQSDYPRKTKMSKGFVSEENTMQMQSNPTHQSTISKNNYLNEKNTLCRISTTCQKEEGSITNQAKHIKRKSKAPPSFHGFSKSYSIDTRNQRNDLTLSFTEIVLISLLPCCYKKNKKYIHFIDNSYVLKSTLDILNVSKTIFDLQRLKLIILSEEQNILFDLTYKKKVSDMEEEKKKFSHLYIDDHSYINSTTVQEAYNKVKQLSHNAINQHLLENIELKSIELFNKKKSVIEKNKCSFA